MKISLLQSGEARWYSTDGTTFLPSVSTVLGALKDGLEYVSPYDLKKAADRGIKIHTACDDLEAGKELQKQFFTEAEWDMLGGFIAWHRAHSPKVLLTEERVVNRKLGYGGTLDRVYDIGGVVTLVDIKTTSAIYDKHWLQVAAYAKCVKGVERTAILRLTDRSKAKYQFEVREGWKKDFKAFAGHLGTWKYLNDGAQPKRSELPDTLSLSL